MIHSQALPVLQLTMNQKLYNDFFVRLCSVRVNQITESEYWKRPAQPVSSFSSPFPILPAWGSLTLTSLPGVHSHGSNTSMRKVSNPWNNPMHCGAASIPSASRTSLHLRARQYKCLSFSMQHSFRYLKTISKNSFS